MTFTSEFSYPDISQRRIILLNSLFSFLILGFIFTHASILLNYYFIYQPVMQIVLVIGSIGIFTGNLTGKLLFSWKKNRLIYIFTDIIFLLACLFYLFGKHIIPGSRNFLLDIFFYNKYYLILLLFTIPYFLGIKTRYFLKTTCGDFIDNKRAVVSFVFLMLTGITAGIVLSVALYYYSNIYPYAGFLLLLVFPTVFFIKLSYNPTPIYAQEIKDKNTPAPKEENQKRDDLLFVYLNFTYILIYVFLGFNSAVKYSGDFFHVKIYFILITMLSLAVGIISARILKQAFWHIYAEMLYPVFFLISLIFIHVKSSGNYLTAVLFFIPVSIVLGFSLFHAINHILSLHNHNNRFNIINFSIFILPAPIIVSLNFVDFTYFWYFILLYVISILNIFIPGIYLLQTNVKGYKKILFLIFSLLFIPLIILFHMYFNIPLNRNLYISHTNGFNSLNTIDVNSRYNNNEAKISINGIKAFHADDSSIRNMKRTILPAVLFMKGSWDEAVFIDGNHKFFRNPVISFLKNTTCVDYVPGRIADYNTLPVSGDRNYTIETSDLLFYLSENKSPLKMIVDIPNMYDQACNAFRFSSEYYDIINRHLNPDGIFIQIISMNCRKDFISGAAIDLKKTYKYTIGFYFPDYLVLVSSNNDGSIKLGQNNINNFRALFEVRPEMKSLFYNEYHLLSHIIFLEIDDFVVYLDKEKPGPFYLLEEKDKLSIDKNFLAAYTDNNALFLELADKTAPNPYYINAVQNIAVNKTFLSDLKKMEIFEAGKEYENESSQLIDLRKRAEYMEYLRKYIQDILSYKEDYYYKAAVHYETDKKWEEARKLYRAVLTINKNNFEANYRLGILSIILQDMNGSFEYLQYALQLSKNNPKVLYQIGVLLFSNGRIKEALSYFEKALALKENTASLLYYMGYCYEEMDNLPVAVNYYNQATILDPNDKNIITAIERIKEKTGKKQDELNSNDSRNNHMEVEQGEDMPLPVEDSAINVRIEGDKAESPQKN